MTNYEGLREGYKRVREIHQRIFPELDKRTREEIGVFVYYVDRPFSSKSEDLVGLIVSPEDLLTLHDFVFHKTVYRKPSCKRLVGIDIESNEAEKILRYGINQSEYGKIVMRDNELMLIQEKLLGSSLQGKGINVTGSIPLVLEEMLDVFETLPDLLGKEVAKNLKDAKLKNQ